MLVIFKRQHVEGRQCKVSSEKKYRENVMRPLREDQSHHTRPSRSIALKTEKRLQIRCFPLWRSNNPEIHRESVTNSRISRNMVPPKSTTLALKRRKNRNEDVWRHWWCCFCQETRATERQEQHEKQSIIDQSKFGELSNMQVELALPRKR